MNTETDSSSFPQNEESFQTETETHSPGFDDSYQNSDQSETIESTEIDPSDGLSSPKTHQDDSKPSHNLSHSELLRKIADQISYYFSDANIFRDAHLRDLILSDEEESVPISVFLGFNKIKSLSSDEQTVIEALTTASDLSVDLEQKTVKRISPYPLTNIAMSRTCYVAGLPSDFTYPQLRELIVKETGLQPVSIIFRRNKSNNFRGSAYVQLSTQEDHNTLLKFTNKIYISPEDDPLHIESQLRYYNNRPDKGRSRGSLRYRDFARALAARKGCLLEVKRIGTASREQIRNKFEKLGTTIDVEISKTGRSASIQFLDAKEVDYIMETYSSEHPFILDGQETEFIRVTQHRVRPWTKQEPNGPPTSKEPRNNGRRRDFNPSYNRNNNYRDRREKGNRGDRRSNSNHRDDNYNRDSRKYSQSRVPRHRNHSSHSNGHSNGYRQPQSARKPRHYHNNEPHGVNQQYLNQPISRDPHDSIYLNGDHSSHNPNINTSYYKYEQNPHMMSPHSTYSDHRRHSVDHDSRQVVYNDYVDPAPYYSDYSGKSSTSVAPIEHEIHHQIYDPNPIRQKRSRDRNQSVQIPDHSRKYYTNESYNDQYYDDDYSNTSQHNHNGGYYTYNS